MKMKDMDTKDVKERFNDIANSPRPNLNNFTPDIDSTETDRELASFSNSTPNINSSQSDHEIDMLNINKDPKSGYQRVSKQKVRKTKKTIKGKHIVAVLLSITTIIGVIILIKRNNESKKDSPGYSYEDNLAKEIDDRLTIIKVEEDYQKHLENEKILAAEERERYKEMTDGWSNPQIEESEIETERGK